MPSYYHRAALNAPTALLALCAAVREGRVRPALIVAMPVGFVAVAQSKEEALRLPVPVITVILAFNFLGDGLRDAADPYG